jgi:hypothetical protein
MELTVAWERWRVARPGSLARQAGVGYWTTALPGPSFTPCGRLFGAGDAAALEPGSTAGSGEGFAPHPVAVVRARVQSRGRNRRTFLTM